MNWESVPIDPRHHGRSFVVRILSNCATLEHEGEIPIFTGVAGGSIM